MNRTEEEKRGAVIRIVAAIAAALAFSLGVYVLIEATQPTAGLVSFSFLLVLPAAVSAFVTYVADPFKTRRHRDYLAMPFWILLAVIVLSLFLLQEGVICILLLAPLWLVSGLVGAELTYRLRRRNHDGRSYCVALIALPLVAMQVEPHVVIPVDTATVTREIVIDAPAGAIWPLLRGIPDVRPDEGLWTLAHSLVGLPRPLGAQLPADGVGADRFAAWEHGIRFRERITDWEAGRRIGWTFIFDDIAGWAYTDRHLMPDSAYFRVTDGGYRVEPLPGGRHRVVLHTSYRIQTPVNGYSRLWGELFLGDVENNILAIIKQRAERAQPRAAAPDVTHSDVSSEGRKKR